MRKYITYAVAAFFAMTVVAFAAGDKAAIEAKEKEAWQTFKDKKEADFKKLVDKDFRGVYADGVYNLKKQVDDMKKWNMKSFAISDFHAFSDEPDVFVVTYVVKVQGTNGGKDASGTYNAGSVWKQEKGTWMAIFHTSARQETAK